MDTDMAIFYRIYKERSTLFADSLQKNGRRPSGRMLSDAAKKGFRANSPLIRLL